MGVAEVGLAEVGFAEMGFAEMGLAEVGFAEVGVSPPDDSDNVLIPTYGPVVVHNTLRRSPLFSTTARIRVFKKLKNIQWSLYVGSYELCKSRDGKIRRIKTVK